MAKGIFGERLKRERELREVSLEEISSATRIARRFLEALENEQWDKLPGGVFGRGFVRSIARYLGLNEEDLLSEYDLVRGESSTPAPPKSEERIPAPPKWIPVALVLALIAVLAGLVIGGRYVWRAFGAHRGSKKASTNVSVTPLSRGNVSPNAATDSSSASVAKPASLELTVATSAATRLRVAADGATAYDAAISSGQTLHFSATDKFEVTAGNSSAVLLELNGHELPPIGLPGSSGTISLTSKDLRATDGAATHP